MKIIDYIIKCLIIMCAIVGFAPICSGDETVVRNQAAFLETVFQGAPPSPEYIWITPSVKATIEAILMHEYKGLRIKYWQGKEQTVWILQETPKEQPVYVGVAVERQKIRKLEVLYAVGRWGSQVQNINFTRQYENVAFDDDGSLSKTIDGISGATLSVNAVSRLAQLALALDEEIHKK